MRKWQKDMHKLLKPTWRHSNGFSTRIWIRSRRRSLVGSKANPEFSGFQESQDLGNQQWWNTFPTIKLPGTHWRNGQARMCLYRQASISGATARRFKKVWKALYDRYFTGYSASSQIWFRYAYPHNGINTSGTTLQLDYIFLGHGQSYWKHWVSSPDKTQSELASASS